MIIGKNIPVFRIKKILTKPGFQSGTADDFNEIIEIVNPIEEGISIQIWVNNKNGERVRSFLTQPIERIKKLTTGKFSVETPTSFYEVEEVT